jgi:hypothetical protein
MFCNVALLHYCCGDRRVTALLVLSYGAVSLGSLRCLIRVTALFA